MLTQNNDIKHNSLLPEHVIQQVPEREKLALSFILNFLDETQQPAQLLVNGGYVRDLLLGKKPDDLDISLCLRECDPSITVSGLLEGLDDFSQRHPEYNVSGVQFTTILSDASKDKNVDTVKAFLSVGTPAERLELDIMPTIGEERYDEVNRVPERDVRGTAEQDALRRDLTIGAMLLHVTQPNFGPLTIDSPDTALQAAERLEWRLLDYYGGLQDLRAGLLRSPFPMRASFEIVKHTVLRSDEEIELARYLGLLDGDCPSTQPMGPTLYHSEKVESPSIGESLVVGTSPMIIEESYPVEVSTSSEYDKIQAVWWIKVLRDDPLRVLRALRFSVKLGFQLHESFWKAIPFALTSLQTKVAGSRKKDELIKIARSGRKPLLDFLGLAFGRPLPILPPSALRLNCLAPALFGGANVDGDARFLSPSIMRSPVRPHIPTYNAVSAVNPFSVLTDELRVEEEFGIALAAAVFSCGHLNAGRAGGDGGEGAPLIPKTIVTETEFTLAQQMDAAAAEAASRAHDEVAAACDGLCASNELRQAALTPLYCVRELLTPQTSDGTHFLWAEAASQKKLGITDSEFANCVHMWDTLKMGSRTHSAGYLPEFIIALAATRCSAETAEALSRRLRGLEVVGPEISGQSLGAIPFLPVHLRATTISQLHIFCRLVGHIDAIDTASKLGWLLGEYDLLDKLEGEWYSFGEGGSRVLRAEYARTRPPPKERGRKKGR